MAGEEMYDICISNLFKLGYYSILNEQCTYPAYCLMKKMAINGSQLAGNDVIWLVNLEAAVAICLFAARRVAAAISQ
jgi:hypothetical protein